MVISFFFVLFIQTKIYLFVDVVMGNMISIPESRYIELLEIEKKYKADNFNNDTDNDKFRTLYAELKSKNKR